MGVICAWCVWLWVNLRRFYSWPVSRNFVDYACQVRLGQEYVFCSQETVHDSVKHHKKPEWPEILKVEAIECADKGCSDRCRVVTSITGDAWLWLIWTWSDKRKHGDEQWQACTGATFGAGVVRWSKKHAASLWLDSGNCKKTRYGRLGFQWKANVRVHETQGGWQLHRPDKSERSAK